MSEHVAKCRDTERTRDLMTRLYTAALDGDIAAMPELLHPDVEIEEAASLPFGGTYGGHDGLLALFGTIGRLLDLSKLKPQTCIADGEQGLVVLDIPVHGAADTARVAEQWTTRNGKLWRCQVFVFDPAVIHPPTDQRTSLSLRPLVG
jgi:uncharacterized protein